MRNLCARVGVMVAAFLTWTSAAAIADPVQATFTVTVNPLFGQHQVDGGQIDQLSAAPLPLGELVLRRRNDGIRIEGLPPVTFRYGAGSGDGTQSTQLSLINATYRRWFAGGWFVGAGQTLYNQFTNYAGVNGTFAYVRDGMVFPIHGREAQYSRVTGARFEVGRTAQWGRNSFELLVGGNPRMRGVQYTRIPTAPLVCPGLGPCPLHQLTFADPENAGQLDLSARIAHRLSRGTELVYGVRYLNYSAHYDDFPGKMADRNVGFAPTIGVRLRL